MSLLKLQGNPCSKRWDDLARTNRDGVRSCSECRKLVYRALNVASLKGYVEAGQCVSVPAPLARNLGLVQPGPCVITKDAKTPIHTPNTPYELPSFLGRVDIVKKETPDDARKRNEHEDRGSEQ